MSKIWDRISTRTLVYGGSWDDAKSTIRALTYGKMIELARDTVQYYISDLYHDALWLNQELIEPGEFQWIARESGTWIGETALQVRDDKYTTQTRYKFVIREEGYQKWVLDTYEQIEDTGDWREEIPGTGVNYYGQPVEDVVQETNVPDTISWADRHAALDINECENAKAIEGCIFHPAPVGGWTKETTDKGYDDIVKMLFEPNIPTLRNDLNTEPSAPLRKEMKMDDIIRDLRDKFSEADSTKDQLEEFVSNINDAVEELETYLSDLDDLINSLDSLPEVSIYVDLDTVSFDS